MIVGRTMINFHFRFSICFFFSFLLFNCEAFSKSLNFGVVPQQKPEILLKAWKPILTHIQKKIGKKVEFVTAPNIGQFKKRLLSGKYDLVYSNPMHYVLAAEAQGYEAIVKAKEKSINGILTVHKESKLKNIKEIEGSKVAFPSKAAFGASVLIRYFLHREGISFKPVWVKTHDNVYEGVARKIFKVGGGVKRTLNATKPATKEKLRILWTSADYTPHAIAVHKRIKAKEKLKIQKAFISINEDKKVLLHVQNELKLNGYEIGVDSDWDDVRGIRKSIESMENKY